MSDPQPFWVRKLRFTRWLEAAEGSDCVFATSAPMPAHTRSSGPVVSARPLKQQVSMENVSTGRVDMLTRVAFFPSQSAVPNHSENKVRGS